MSHSFSFEIQVVFPGGTKICENELSENGRISHVQRPVHLDILVVTGEEMLL